MLTLERFEPTRDTDHVHAEPLNSATRTDGISSSEQWSPIAPWTSSGLSNEAREAETE